MQDVLGLHQRSQEGYAHGLAGGVVVLALHCIPAEISNYELAAAFQTYESETRVSPRIPVQC